MREDIQELRAGLRRLGEQQASDFQFMGMALKETGQHFRLVTGELATRLDMLGREMEERFNQIEGRMKLSEQRLGAMLQAVDRGLGDHEQRISALESKSDPAT